MAKRKQAEELASQPDSEVVGTRIAETSADAAALVSGPNSQESARGGATSAQKDKFDLAREKLARMEETNKLCFRHRNDLAKIEQELGRLGYGESDVEYLMDPKGQRMIPGFGFAEIERQRQFVNFLTARRGSRTDDGFAASEEQRRDAIREPELS